MAKPRFWRAYDSRVDPPYARRQCDFCQTWFDQGWLHEGQKQRVWQCKRCHGRMEREITAVNKMIREE